MPISWMVLHDTGNIGFTYTDPLYRKMGLSALVLTKISQIVSSKGLQVSLIAIDAKIEAISYYQKYGFEESLHNNCIFFIPKDKTLADYEYKRLHKKM